MLEPFKDNKGTQVLLPPTLNMAFRFFEPRIAEPFPNEKLLRKKKIVATKQTIFNWEMALRFTVQIIWMPRSMSVAKVTEYVHWVFGVKLLRLMHNHCKKWPKEEKSCCPLENQTYWGKYLNWGDLIFFNDIPYGIDLIQIQNFLAFGLKTKS